MPPAASIERPRRPRGVFPGASGDVLQPGQRARQEAQARSPVPSMSLVIITRCRPEPLRAALESAIRALPDRAEVIVVDGDPLGSARRVVNDVRARAPESQLRYEASAAGTCVQRNIGIDRARGEVVVLIDDDSTVEPGTFDALLGAYQDPEVMGATGRVDGPATRRIGSNPNSRLRWLILGRGRQGTMSSFGFRNPIVDVAQPRDVEFMPGPLMSARRELAASVRFDEALTDYGLGEDDDFSYRLSRNGRVRYVPAAVVCHRELGSQRMDRRRLDRLQVINRAYLFRKNFPQTLRARAAFACLLALLCAHRALNREWSGLRGLLGGIWHVYGPRAGGATPL
jgi:GT2 family glycosyltransferase